MVDKQLKCNLISKIAKLCDNCSVGALWRKSVNELKSLAGEELTAREMFKELGYKLVKLPTSPWRIIEYVKEPTFKGEEGCWISFWKGKYYTAEGLISINLFKAIMKQIEELGWLE